MRDHTIDTERTVHHKPTKNSQNLITFLGAKSTTGLYSSKNNSAKYIVTNEAGLYL